MIKFFLSKVKPLSFVPGFSRAIIHSEYQYFVCNPDAKFSMKFEIIVLSISVRILLPAFTHSNKNITTSTAIIKHLKSALYVITKVFALPFYLRNRFLGPLYKPFMSLFTA